jgi:geranylgeranyl diphosphate synthase type II
LGLFELQTYLKDRAALIERALAATVSQHDGLESRLFEAMRYSLLEGGKRLRPILAMASCEAVGGSRDDAIDYACALEMIHTYSLIHDDLPSMDNDDLRHGKPTNHKVYGDAIATLAGDALVTDAFAAVARTSFARKHPEVVLEVIAELSDAAGSRGMVSGQVIDLLGEGRTMNLEQLEYLHSKKTGALFHASVIGGARLGGATSVQLAALSKYARALGLCFQVVDDLLDVEASTEQMGKRTNKDEAAGKNTYPVLMGIEQSHALARDLESRAQAALSSFDHRAEALRAIANFVVERKH